jgi:hypothetical protein
MPPSVKTLKLEDAEFLSSFSIDSSRDRKDTHKLRTEKEIKLGKIVL